MYLLKQVYSSFMLLGSVACVFQHRITNIALRVHKTARKCPAHTLTHTSRKDRDKWTGDKWQCGLMQSIIPPSFLLLILTFNMHSILNRALWKAKMKGTLLMWMNDWLLQLSLRNYNGTIANRRASAWRMKSFSEERCRFYFFLGFILILKVAFAGSCVFLPPNFSSGKSTQSKHLQKGNKSHQFLRCRHFHPRKVHLSLKEKN